MTTIARIKVWVPGDVLTASDLNGEFNNIINVANGQIDSNNINMSAAYTWTGAHTHNNNVTIGTDKYLYFRDTNAYLRSSSATDMVWYVDGNLFLTLGNSSGNRFIQASQNILLAGNKIITDGSATGDTHIQESSANVLDLTVGGTLMARFDTGGGVLFVDANPPGPNRATKKSVLSAWITFSCTGASSATSEGDYNVSSVSCASYDVTVNWNTDFSNTAYCVVSTDKNGSGGACTPDVVGAAVGSCVFYFYQAASAVQTTATWGATAIAIGPQ